MFAAIAAACYGTCLFEHFQYLCRFRTHKSSGKLGLIVRDRVYAHLLIRWRTNNWTSVGLAFRQVKGSQERRGGSGWGGRDGASANCCYILLLCRDSCIRWRLGQYQLTRVRLQLLALISPSLNRMSLTNGSKSGGSVRHAHASPPPPPDRCIRMRSNILLIARACRNRHSPIADARRGTLIVCESAVVI